MKYRSRTEIVAHILEVAVGGNTRTKIMYKAFLSYEQTNEYLTFLRENGLLDYDKATNMYKTTEKGARILKLYEELAQMMQKRLL